ncbi:hypothetical protein [Brevibacillus brevis]|uniref:hypothetical protein n=1 Tax=Brevibacillus brevis TaxID=1393 RepID=UPI0007D8A739|nr:hypothetical protein [Brevibacillus brevis]
MTKNNDQKILELKKQIEDKKQKLSKSKKFSPVTNCSIEIDGVRHNIQVLGKDVAQSLLIKLNSYALSAKDLGILDDYYICGYKLKEWIEDLKGRYNHITRKEEEQKLKAMENKLDHLLSNEKRVELEIGEIAEMLKD